jgi:hypothetical protein
MWVVAFSMYAGCKWLTWWHARTAGVAPPALGRSLGYLLLWPGMDARAFLDLGAEVPEPSRGAWLMAGAKTLVGAILVWGVVRMIPSERGLLATWTGCLGLILVLHFGTFELIALAWQRAGVRAEPLMNLPGLATSLGDFWGGRWNRAFSQIAFVHLLRPMARWLGAGGAMMAVFLVSGLAHELVISLPARGGYGLPTGYFLLQGAGILLERSRAGRRLGLGRGVAGWLAVVVVTAGPAYWLFHPPFMRNVALPFLEVIGAWNRSGP